MMKYIQNNYELVEVDSNRASPIVALCSNTTINHRKVKLKSYNETYQTNHVIDTQLPPRIRPLVKGNPALSLASYNRNMHPRQTGHLLRGARNRKSKVDQWTPLVEDVHDIDRWSRLCFPVLFFLFNVLYWSYFKVRPQTLTQKQ